jgi:hypothetical protein|tara:strand:+ start:47 stop:487 length:441 start_codon:yes stop_codon:yes gene_type:complete
MKPNYLSRTAVVISVVAVAITVYTNLQIARRKPTWHIPVHQSLTEWVEEHIKGLEPPIVVKITTPDKWYEIPLKNASTLSMTADRGIEYTFDKDSEYSCGLKATHQLWQKFDNLAFSLYVRAEDIPCEVDVFVNLPGSAFRGWMSQ